MKYALEPLIHFIVPFIALTLIGVKFREATLISLLAVLPDLDALFHVHRSISHSLTILTVATVPLLLLTYRYKPRLRGYIVLAFLAVASHLVMDLFTGYTPILWPLYSRAVRVKAELGVHISSGISLDPSVRVLTKDLTFQPFQSLDASIFTGEVLMLTAVLLTPFIYKALKAWWPRATQPRKSQSN